MVQNKKTLNPFVGALIQAVIAFAISYVLGFVINKLIFVGLGIQLTGFAGRVYSAVRDAICLIIGSLIVVKGIMKAKPAPAIAFDIIGAIGIEWINWLLAKLAYGIFWRKIMGAPGSFVRMIGIAFDIVTFVLMFFFSFAAVKTASSAAKKLRPKAVPVYSPRDSRVSPSLMQHLRTSLMRCRRGSPQRLLMRTPLQRTNNRSRK